ncbi:MAG: hypothetical protein M3A44_04420 [Gammaproteobacteria bacterium]
MGTGGGGFAVEILIPHVGFGGDVAVRRIGIALGRGAGDAGEAVEFVVTEAFGEALDVVLARGEVAGGVVGIGQVLDGAAGGDALDSAQGVEAACGGEAVAQRFLGDAAFCVGGEAVVDGEALDFASSAPTHRI